VRIYPSTITSIQAAYWSNVSEPAGDREVAMNGNTAVRVEIEAAQALVRWKALFADEVAQGARRLAAETGDLGPVTLAHYRRAAQLALRALSIAILDGEPSGDDQKAA
jgi:hypothetical protein